MVLAGGAIENASLLLNSTAQCSAGLGNQLDNVGRFFMDHPRVLLGHGSCVRPGALDLYRRHNLGDQLVEGRLTLSETVLRREELLNGGLYVVPNASLTTAQVHAWRSARVAINKIKRRKFAAVPSHLAMVGPHGPSLAWRYLHQHLRRSDEPVQVSEDSEAPLLSFEEGTGVRARSCELVYQPELAPNRVNRVTLSERRDAFGYRIAYLSWRWSEIDLLSIRRAGQIFTSELRASCLAELIQQEDDLFPQGQQAPRPPSTAHHLLGTTRMHDVPRHGVVDRACRVHGSSSVYVAGASVFPTAGFANPTLTVVALAIRLADELRRTLSTQARLTPVLA